MSDIVERLRNHIDDSLYVELMCEKAADEIERLREALKPFARMADACGDVIDARVPIMQRGMAMTGAHRFLTANDFYAARAALGAKE